MINPKLKFEPSSPKTLCAFLAQRRCQGIRACCYSGKEKISEEIYPEEKRNYFELLRMDRRVGRLLPPMWEGNATSKTSLSHPSVSSRRVADQ